MHLFYAKTIADDLVNRLTPYCDVINIAGSVRRKKEEVKDIEIVCIAKRTEHIEQDLFNEVVSETIVVHPGFIAAIKSIGKILKGKFTGRYMQIEMNTQIEGTAHIINIDVFMPQQHDYIRQYAIRTGSSEYAKRHIAIQWNKRGWCGTEYGLRKISECYKVSETKWVMKKEFLDRPTLPPLWRNEEEFFRWLGVQYLDPWHRSL